MTPAAIICEAAADGVSLELSPAGTIKATGDQASVNRWLPVLRENKHALLEALAHPDDIALWWRVAVREPGGRTVEVDTPNGWTRADWQAYAERYHGPGCAVTPIAGLPKPRAPVNLHEVLRAACEGVAGITPEVFRSLLTPEDMADIEAGGIHHRTLKAYAPVIRRGDAVGADRGPGGQGEAVSYEIILADPPWSYRDSANAGKRGGVVALSRLPTA